MIPHSILDMINDATKKAYILTALEYIKKECEAHSDDNADEKGIKDVCEGCPFNGIDDWCFFQAPYFEGKTPEEWDLDKLTENLKKENANDKR